MKNYILLVLFLLFAAKNIDAQEVLKSVPALPTNVCIAGNEMQKQFEEQISALIRDIELQARALKKQSKPDEARAKEQAGQMLIQQGLSQEDIDKMKSKNMTKEEKQAMADKMMQQYTNMSMSEASSMKNMSKEGKQAYVEAYASEAQATGQANAQTNAKNNNPQIVNTNNTADVISQRNILYQQIKSRQQDVQIRYQHVEQDVEGLKIVEKMNSIRTRIRQLVGSGGEGGWNEKDKKEYDTAITSLNQLKKNYCQRMSPLYISALNYHFADLQSSYGDYLELDKMTGKIDNSIISTGTTWNGGSIEYFEWVETYLNYLKDVYKYNPVIE
jgi:hypothetical protein